MGAELRAAYVIKFHEREIFLEPGEDSLDSGLEYVAPFSGDIICRREDPQEGLEPSPERDQIVGRFQGYVIQAARAINDGVDLLDHCDAHSQDICDYAAAFYDKDGGFKEELEAEFMDGGSGQNLLIIDEIALHPAHRGRLVGLRTLRRLMEVLGDGCGFAATIPHPLQFQQDGVDELAQHPERSRKRAEQQLALYIDRLGFERLPGTRMYAWSLAQRLPDLEIVGRPAKVLPLLFKSQGTDADLPSP